MRSIKFLVNFNMGIYVAFLRELGGKKLSNKTYVPKNSINSSCEADFNTQET